MKKPEPPKSRLIRINVLPEQDPMKNYRIKAVTDKYSTRYYPQHKLFGLFWMNIIFPIYSWDCDYCDTLEDAQDVIREHSSKPVVEYIEVDCGEPK